MELSDKVKALYHITFNAKFASLSAGFNAPIAAFVNSSYGLSEMLFAGGSQAVSSFISTGITSRIVQHFSPIENKFISYFFGSLVPASTTFVMSYIAHKINGTPKVIESCIAPTLISYTTSYATNFITRRGYMRPENYPVK